MNYNRVNLEYSIFVHVYLDYLVTMHLFSLPGLWFSADTLVFSTNKTDRHDITEILLKLALNTITLTFLILPSI